MHCTNAPANNMQNCVKISVVCCHIAIRVELENKHTDCDTWSDSNCPCVLSVEKLTKVEGEDLMGWLAVTLGNKISKTKAGGSTVQSEHNWDSLFDPKRVKLCPLRSYIVQNV